MVVASCVILMLAAPTLRAAEPAPPAAASPAPPEEDYAARLPRIPPVEPDAALGTFLVQPGFRLEQVAAEPLVADPVAMAFDEHGRLYVAAMHDYSEQDKEALGVVRLLEDTDGDGRFDRSQVFADGLSWPTAIACWDGGVFVGAAPDLIYLKDTTGDGRADVREVVFTGFERSNVQGLINSFHWGLDQRLHGSSSTAGGTIKPVTAPEAPPLSLRGRDFALEPRHRTLAAESGGGQHGMSLNDWGERFVSANSDHIQQIVFEDRYLARNPFARADRVRVSIAADGPQAEVYRASPVEPWRVLRTELRVSGAVPGAVEGGGRAAGYFTGATGVTIYRGHAWPEEWRGIAVVADVGSNLVHRKRLEPNGLEYVARRIDRDGEFVASKDIWFRPVQFANAPDGTLYILDMYREVIEHPASLPPPIKRHLDLTSGRDRGRLYRIVPEGFTQPPRPQLGAASTAELVATLAHPNGWHRDTASRLLYERQDPASHGPLRALARSGDAPLGRLHAWSVLAALGGMTAEDAERALADPHPGVRRQAVLLAEQWLASRAEGASPPPSLVARLFALADDADVKVRFQTALALGALPEGAERNAALARIARRDPDDRWIALAVQTSLFDGAGPVLAELAADAEYRGQPGGRGLLSKLAAQIAEQNRPADVALALAALEALPADEVALAGALARPLSRNLARPQSALATLLAAGKAARFEALLEASLAGARTAAVDDARPLAARLDALQTLASAPFESVRALLIGLLDQRQPQEVQLAAVGTLGQFQDPAVAAALVEAWPRFSPRVREAAAEALLARADRVLVLFDALASGRVSTADLDPNRLRALAKHRDPEVRRRAESVVGSLGRGRRDEVVAAYRPALTLSGDVDRGRAHFRKICAACHKLEGVGHELGPSLATIRHRGAEAILLNVLDPSREVNPQFVNYLALLDDGRTMSGMITAETATSLTLTRAEGAHDTVLRQQIEELQSTGLSLMPEGIEKQLDPQALADVIAYLMKP